MGEVKMTKVSELKSGDKVIAYGGVPLKPIFVLEVVELSKEPEPYDKSVYILKLRLISKNGKSPKTETITDKPVRLDWTVEKVDGNGTTKIL